MDVPENVKNEIEKIRKNIEESFSNIEFFEKKHEYFVTSCNERVKYECVSNVIKQFNQPFDTDTIANNYAIKNNLLKEDVLKSWKYNNLCSTISGTRTHLFGEAYTWLQAGKIDKIPKEILPQFVKEENWLIPTSPKEVSIVKFYEDLPKDIYPIGAEYMMSSEHNTDITTKMCGTTDILFYFDNKKNPEKSGVIIGDWKGLDIATPIFTIDGWKTMNEIQEGDIVFDMNGNPTEVLHVSDIHMNECYKITFSNKASVICDMEHRWYVKYKGEFHVKTTLELLDIYNEIEIPHSKYLNVMTDNGYDININEYCKDEKLSKDILLGNYYVRLQALKILSQTDNYDKLRQIVGSFGLTVNFKDNDKPTIESSDYHITNIEKVETVPTKCIEVDSDTHTYLFGYDFIVTHNTNKKLINTFNRNSNKTMLPPFDYLIDEDLSHYSLQFGCYELMLKSIGIPIVGRRLIWLKDDGYEIFKIDDRTKELINIL